MSQADEANTINLKLFPTRPPPAPIRAWHVPLLTIQPSLLSLPSTSDLTLTRILPYINGIRSVAQIARLADTDLSLARKAVAHLLYYGCVLLLDIFQFSAVYAPTAEIGQFVEDEEAQDEAVAYVSVGQYCQVTATDTPGDGFTTLSSSHTSHRSHRAAKKPSSVNIELSSTPTGSGAGSKPASHPSSNPDITQSGTPKPSPSGRWEWHPSSTSLTRARIVQLYTTLKPGLSLRQWCVENETLLSGVDVRRFVTFGIIKGFLYRVHRYAYANVANGTAVSDRAQPAPGAAERIARWDAQLKYTNGNGNTMTAPGAEVTKARLATKDLPLARYLDGLHCFDEICTELQMSEKEVLGKMKAAYGDVQIISR